MTLKVDLTEENVSGIEDVKSRNIELLSSTLKNLSGRENRKWEKEKHKLEEK